MTNALLFFLSILVSFAALLIIYRFFGKNGLFAWIAFAAVFANIEVLKTITCFSLETTLGNALFGTIFLATDIISETYGKKTAQKAIACSFAVSSVFIILSQIDLAFIPNENDFAHSSFQILFSLTPRVCIGSMAAFALGNMVDVALYNKLKTKQGNKLIWLRNNLCTLLSQLIDNFIFYFIAFYRIIPTHNLLIICINVWIMEAVTALLDTPFLYIAKYKIKTEKKNEENN